MSCPDDTKCSCAQTKGTLWSFVNGLRHYYWLRLVPAPSCKGAVSWKPLQSDNTQGTQAISLHKWTWQQSAGRLRDWLHLPYLCSAISQSTHTINRLKYTWVHICPSDILASINPASHLTQISNCIRVCLLRTYVATRPGSKTILPAPGQLVCQLPHLLLPEDSHKCINPMVLKAYMYLCQL